MNSAADILLLIEDKELVTPDILNKAKEQVSSEDHLDEDEATVKLLLDSEYLTWDKIMDAYGETYDMPVHRLEKMVPEHEALSALDEDQARRYEVFPLRLNGDALVILTSDPLALDTADSISKLLKRPVELELASLPDIRQAINNFYTGIDDAYSDVISKDDMNQIGIEGMPGEDEVDEEQAPIIRYVQQLIMEAIKRRASDIHLEPLEKRFRVRYRVDGVLQEVENPPKRLQPNILARLKLMSNVSIAEKRVPQDGRIQVKSTGRDLDLRVSTLPTAFGESIVMRILDKEGLKLGLPELGFFSDDQEVINRIINHPDGIFLVTGPTGSGKSTTLYSCLNTINFPDRKIITVEDPVEYQMAGINQVQVNKAVNMDFAAALRAMLRQAPNIIMVGEIRDKETAEIAINASLTGHMVFSTLHTNDAPSAVSRLVDIGIKPFLVSASLRAAMAQRLVRVICKDCKAPYDPEVSELHSLGINEAQASSASFMKGKGCPTCHGTGYKGRNGIFEVCVIDEEIQQMIYEHATIVELRAKARELGMRTMREDGIRKVLAGVTTIDEVAATTVSYDD